MNIHNIKNEEIQSFVLLTKEYVEKVNIASKELCNFLQLENLCDWRVAKIPIKGFFHDGLWKYNFHGSGCNVITPNFEVDFEFDTNCVVGGFDSWRLWSFVCDNKNLSRNFEIFKEKETLEVIFKKAENLDIIRKEIEGKPSDLYFLKGSEGGRT